jgi:hypothetical protein
MIVTNKHDTATGIVEVSAEVDFEIPKAGDTIHIYGTAIVLKQDMKVGLDFTYNEETRKYQAVPLRTTDGTNRLCFYADGFSWRPGEYFTAKK